MHIEIPINNLSLRKCTGTRLWVIERDFNLVVDNKTITVPRGFVTNLASTPRPLWPIFPPSGIYTEASVVHDYLYDSEVVSRKTADKIYKEICRLCGVSELRSSLMYGGLRLFGGIHRSLTRNKKKIKEIH